MSDISLVYSGLHLEGDYEKVFPVETDTIPKRSADVIDIPGRNGNLLLDNKKYEDVNMVYNIVYLPSPQGYMSLYERVRQTKTILLNRGYDPTARYQELKDSNYPAEFYMAYVSEDINVIYSPDRSMAKVRVTFSRKPQRFLVAGNAWKAYSRETAETEYRWTFTESNTEFETEPLIKVTGYGQLTINDKILTISGTDPQQEIFIDCESKECYAETSSGVVSRNSFVSMSGYDFPTVKRGENAIVLGTGVYAVMVKTRAWRL